MFDLRDYQQETLDAVEKAWGEGVTNALAVLPTGAGKTVCMSQLIKQSGLRCVAVAHRQELVSQISMALARNSVHHSLIAPPSVIKICVKLHTDELGRSYFDPSADVSVAGVDTLIRRDLGSWADGVGMWVIDEAHHVLKENKWGKALRKFPNARGLGVTATPLRADGKGLGAHVDGVFEAMHVGSSMRELIDRGFLTEYRIFAPPSSFVRPDKVGASGDFTRGAMSLSFSSSPIVGDIVGHYKRIAAGKRGVTFVPDTQIADHVAEQFRAAGVPAKSVNAKTPERERAQIIREFRDGVLQQLVNVDLFGEGFDLPAIEVVSMGRPTESYGLYVQQFGRALRKLEGKEKGIIIDHVGNVMRHGLPDAYKEWTLDAREKRSSSSSCTIPTWTCLECMSVQETHVKECPCCGASKPAPTARSAPEFVDGDLTELCPRTLARLRGSIINTEETEDDVASRLLQKGCPSVGVRRNVKNAMRDKEAQTELRETIAMWAGERRARGYTDSRSYIEFYSKFGVDVLTAQSIKHREATELNERIKKCAH